ncbi:hypothetical protein GOV03_04735 [Candidatus Woesearchaeota archaeon]|nr:hypothetical protein [Candidatus Woesearchaeota archaeon]
MKRIVLLIVVLFLIGCVSEVPTVDNSGSIAVYFCPQDDCAGKLVDFLDSAVESIDCAFYDLGLESVKDKLLEKHKEGVSVRVVIDNSHFDEFEYDFVKKDGWGLQHNKFCVVDNEKLFAGSMNPTENGAFKNDNNILFIENGALVENYLAEFEEMWGGEFKDGAKVLNPEVWIGDILIENYFCPEDSCAERVKEELNGATESIYFMTFSFTHNGIANVLLLKNLAGVDVKGVFENRGSGTEYSKFTVLEYQTDVIKDVNPNTMHHKVFIIDGKTVITGSMNPTKGGDEKNDENVLIIHDIGIAKLFLEEFEMVYDKTE